MKPGQEIVSYTPTRAALADLATRYKDIVFDVTKPDGMRDAKAAAKDIATHRITLEKARVAEKADALAYGRYVDAEAKKIADDLAALEDPIVQQIEVETKREQREREEAVRLEAERLAKEEADRKAAEQAKLDRDREELARVRAELEAKEQGRLEAEAESRRKIEEQERAARARIEEQDRQARELREQAERDAKALRDAEEARLQAEREKVDAERRKLEDDARAEQFAKDEAARAVRLAEQIKREAEENARADAERERRRVVAERADARVALEIFRKRFGHLEEYAGVIKAIDECLEPA